MKYETRIYLYAHTRMCAKEELNGHSHLVRSSPVCSAAHTIACLSRPIKIYGIYEICCRVKCIRNNVIIPPRSHVINTCGGKLEECETSLQKMASFTVHPTIIL
jgi:hypothetical protein